MDYKELKQIIKLAQKSGIKHLKVDGVELSFTDEAITKKPRKQKDDSQGVELKQQYSEMDALLWSVQDFGTAETN